jgi:hypothetical protein
MSFSPLWVPSTQPSIRATRQQREAVTVVDDNCVMYVVTGNDVNVQQSGQSTSLSGPCIRVSSFIMDNMAAPVP